MESCGILVRSTLCNTARSGESYQGIPSLSCAAASERRYAATEREKARIEQAALEEQLRILGVKPKQISPEMSQQLDQVIAKADETIEATRVRIDEAQRRGVADAIRWGEKCVAFSREQVAKARP